MPLHIEDKSTYNTKLTIQLSSILETAKKPLSFKNILTKIGENKYNKTSIYRKLETLESKGIIRAIDLPKMRVWELNSRIRHAHFSCKNCEKVECIEAIFNNLVTTNQIMETVLIGVCQKCLK
jgi:Fe2+ or Zn2+ uptake regulation protein